MNLTEPLGEHDLTAAILASALDCIIAIEGDGTIIEFNPAAERTFGWKKEDVIGRQMAELIIPERYRRAHYDGLARYKRTGEGPVLRKRIELAALRADGTEFPIELAITPIGSLERPRFTAYIRDITERRRFEEQLRHSAITSDLLFKATKSIAEAESFQASLQHCLDFICEITGWPIAHVYLPSEGTQELVPSDVWHVSASDGVEEFRAATSRLRFKPGIGLPGRVWQTGEPIWVPNLAADPNFPRRFALGEQLRSGIGFPIKIGGQTVAVLEFFLHSSAAPDQRLTVLIQAIAQQIGGPLERKRHEQVIKDRERRHAWLLESTTDAVWRFELDRPVSCALPEDEQVRLFYEGAWLAEANGSMARMYGFERPEEMIGTRLEPIMPAANEENLAYLREFIRSGYEIRGAESVERSRTGETRYMLNTLVGEIEDGHLVRAWGSSQDVTARRQWEEELKASLVEKEVLLREVHHRVKNNLQVIASMIDLRARRVSKDSLPHFRALSERVLAIGRVYEQIHRADDLSEIDMGEYLRDLTDLMQEERIAISAEVSPLRASVDVAVPLGLIVLELVTNALKHAFAPDRYGTITIRLKHGPSDEAVLEVVDNGRGFDPQQAPAESSGMRIVQALVNQIGGRFETQARGGTLHRITFPV